MATRTAFALIDMNSFYASCEKLFRPDLRHRPVVVLSNNDGCVVSGCAQAKALGIARGTPAFRLSGLFRAEEVEVFSSNYELYASLSRRVVATVASLVPELEVYSIDECFADVSGLGDASACAQQLRARVQQWTGIFCCVGVAPTKTLAKLCNRLAKKRPDLQGVFVWPEDDTRAQQRILSDTAVCDIWGVGARLTESLTQSGIATALDLVQADSRWLQARFGVTVLRTQRELQGHSCLPLVPGTQTKQQICNSRSFGRNTSRIEDLISAVSVHTAEAVRQLRIQRCVAGCITVFFHTNFFQAHAPQKSICVDAPLAHASDDLLTLTHAALEALQAHFVAGFSYHKAGVILSAISDKDRAQPVMADFFDDAAALRERRSHLMDALEAINTRYGKHTVTTASSRLSTDWVMRREHLSACYTTRIEDVAVVH